MKPVLKWVGGKTSLLPELEKRLPKRFRKYYEPFMGGGALYFHLAPLRATLNDANPELINFYEMIADHRHRDDVLALLEELHRTHSERTYYRVRDEWNNGSVHCDCSGRAAAFFYLNKTAFNGLYRVNAAGEMNTPMGKYKAPKIYARSEIETAGLLLRHARITSNDYRLAVAGARDDDFVYFDPPYDPVSASSSFTAYTTGRFGKNEQRDLAFIATELVERGVQVMISNSDTKYVRELYKHRRFKIHRVTCKRSINSNGAKRGKVAELIITGGYKT